VLQRIRKGRDGESDSGFTLTELLITIVILGILAAIVVFAVGAFSNDGKAAACKTDLKSVEIAVDAYYAKNSKYPAGNSTAERIKVLTDAQYLKQAPSTDHGYTINVDANGVVTGGVGDGATPPPCA